MCMSNRLRKPQKSTIFRALTEVRRPNSSHAQLQCLFAASASASASASELHSFDHRKAALQPSGIRGRGRGLRGQQVLLSNRSSLPLSRMLHSTHDSSFRSPQRQVPSFLPHPSPLCPFQEEMLIPPHSSTYLASGLSLIKNSQASILYFKSGEFLPNFDSKPKTLYLNFMGLSAVSSILHNSDPKAKALYLNYRGLSRAAGDDPESDADLEDGGGGCCENEGEEVKSKADPKEVERVCKVIDELFELDRNMEAVLDECGIAVTHDLVVDVLERFKHARKPAFRFFRWAGQRPEFQHDSRTYNAMMAILGKTRQFETMVAVLEEMGEKRLLIMETFEISIKAFAAAQERKKAVGIFELMKKYKYKVGVSTINCLLDALGRAKLGKEAQALFEKLNGRFTPNLQTYTVLLNGWCRVKNLMEAGRVWNEIIDKNFKPDIVAHNTMLEGLLKSQKRSDAIKFFEAMKAKGPSPNARSYAIMIRSLCKRGKMKEAVDYYEEMQKLGCEPDAAVYTCLMTGFGNQKKMDIVYGLLKEMKEKGCPPDAQLYNALIKLMTNRQMPDDAVRLYKKMIQNGFQPTIHTYNMLMKSYFQIKNYDMGLAVWEEMNCKGCCPDDNTYIVLIGGLIRQGRPLEACKYLEEMIERGMKAPQIDYNKFVADFARAGKPEILEELAQKMKFSGKFEVSNFFARWAEMMKRRVKRRDPVKIVQNCD